MRSARSFARSVMSTAKTLPSNTDGRRGKMIACQIWRPNWFVLKPDIIVTTGTPGALAVMQATQTIPIVMASSADPVSAGLVTSLARPGGNVTGFTILGAELEGKRLEFLKQAIPNLTRVAVIWNPNNPAIVSYFDTLKKVAAPALGITLDPIREVRRADELDNAFAAIASARPQALAVVADRFLLSQRKRIVEFAAAKNMWTPGD
jgi:putative ABC transport system substrate-binding protein